VIIDEKAGFDVGLNFEILEVECSEELGSGNAKFGENADALCPVDDLADLLSSAEVGNGAVPDIFGKGSGDGG
jgi:hypothetical protein